MKILYASALSILLKNRDCLDQGFQILPLSVLQGLGIAQLHDYIIADDVKENRLVEILTKYTEQKKTIPVHISYFPASHVHIKIPRFLDFMIEVADRLNK